MKLGARSTRFQFIQRAALLGAIVALLPWLGFGLKLLPFSGWFANASFIVCPLIVWFGMAAFDYRTGRFADPVSGIVLTLLLVASNALIYAIAAALIQGISGVFVWLRSRATS